MVSVKGRLWQCDQGCLSKFISALDKELKTSLLSTFYPLYQMATEPTYVFVAASSEVFQRYGFAFSHTLVNAGTAISFFK